MALTLPPTVTAALNEATRMSLFRYKGQQADLQPGRLRPVIIAI